MTCKCGCNTPIPEKSLKRYAFKSYRDHHEIGFIFGHQRRNKEAPKGQNSHAWNGGIRQTKRPASHAFA